MRVARSTGAVSGALIVLLGLWAGLVPFVGPYFDLSIGTSAAWHYTDNRLWLDILPAVVAILAGLLLIFARRRATGALGGWLALIAGAWLILGPTVSLLWERGAGGVGAPLGSAHRQAFELLGYFYGVGVLIIALAAYATGRFVSRPRLGEAPNVISLKGAAAKPSAAARPAEEVTAGAPHDAPHAPAGDAPRRRAVLLPRLPRRSSVRG